MTDYPGHPKGVIPPSVLPAVVVSNEDPDKAGRVRVRIPHYHGAEDNDNRVPDDKLPWARPIFPFAGGGGGVFGVPQNGSAVAVMFFSGNYDTIFWIGGFIGDGDLPSEFEDGYDNGPPKTYLIRSAGGHRIELREKNDQVEIAIQTSGGNTVLLDDTNGTISIESAQGNKVELQDAGGQINVTANVQVNVVAPLVTLGPDGNDPVVVESKLLLLYNAHVHPDPQGGNTGTPVVPILPAPASPSVGSQSVKGSA